MSKIKSNTNSKAADILKRLKKTSSIEESCIFNDSDIYVLKESIPTPIPIINLVLSGKFFDGGITRGLTVWAGESRTFKTMGCLLCLKAYLDAHEDGIGMIYDSEFSFSPEYLNSFGIDTSRVFITPITDLDKLKNDVINQVDAIEHGEHVFIMIDSIGNLASLKEVDDAIVGKSTVDLSRAKNMKSLFRMITPRVNLKNIPLFVIAHVYSEMGLYPKTIISGGSGILLSANTAIIMSRRKNSNKDEAGYEFVMKAEKSRFIREGLKFPITIPAGGAIKKYSGLFDLAMQTGFIEKEGMQYKVPELPEYKKQFRKNIEDSDEFWDMMFEKTTFVKTIEDGLKVSVDQSGLFDTSIADALTESNENKEAGNDLSSGMMSEFLNTED